MCYNQGDGERGQEMSARTHAGEEKYDIGHGKLHGKQVRHDKTIQVVTLGELLIIDEMIRFLCIG